MPRAKKIVESQPDRKVFYWSDTGPVECIIEDGFIIEAHPVDDGINMYSWKAGVGNKFEPY